LAHIFGIFLLWYHDTARAGDIFSMFSRFVDMNVPHTDPPVLTMRDGAVTRLVLNRPAARNALSQSLMAALQETLDAAARDEALRVIVLAANGPAFSAGHDLKEMASHRCDVDAGREAFAQIFALCSRLMQSIVRHPKPVIAEVQGIATAAGCQLVASCDLAVASTAARFATPGVNIGLFCSTPMVALSRNVTRKHAMEMLLTGEMIGAEDAQRIGLVNRVVAPDLLESATMKLARQIAAKPVRTVKIGKEAFYRQLEMPLAEAYDYASEVMTKNMLAAEAEEGIGAFLEKRAPKWPE
jgi:enoyl-CoA hydratase/carnithine racemase